MSYERINALLIEDNAADARLMREMLRDAGEGSFELTCADRLSTGLECLSGRRMDVVLLDLNLPDSRGLQTLEHVHARARGAPIIVLTAMDDTDLALDAVRGGAQDYLVKGQVNGDLLTRSMRYAIERKRAEDALSEAARHWEETFDAIEDMVTIINRDHRIVRANQSVENAFPGGKVIGALCYELMHGADAPLPACPAEAAFRSGKATHADVYEAEFGERWFGVRAYPITDEAGAVQQVVHVARDITEQKLAEQQLVRERQFSNAVIETAGALIVVLDPEGRIVRFNRACEELTGFSFEEVKGRPLWGVLVVPEEREALSHMSAALTSGVASATLESHWQTKDGQRCLIAWAYTRLSDDEGNVQWLVGTGIDVTEHRQLEEQLRRAAKLEAVGQLAGGVAHDFNNLLTAILGYVDLNLPDIPEGTQLHGDLLHVKDAAKRASNLTRQLLTFSRQQVAAPMALDLNETVGDVCKMLRHLIEEKVEMQVALSEQPLTVMADPAQVGQVLMNLAVNARDAMPDGGLLTVETSVVEILQDEAATGWEADTGRYAVLTVTDTGVGMPPEVTARIFDPFFTTKDVGEGTGLGLSTVYGIVQQHKGFIECQSEPGKGTAFRVCLPFTEVAEAAAQQKTDSGLSTGGDETILLVEDEEEVRTLASRILSDLGYTVLPAADGLEALGLLRHRRDGIDLLVTDLVMPKMGGCELAQSVRLMQPDAKLLFMSGYTGEATAGPGGDLPAVPVLQKPFTAHALAERVRDALDTG